MVLACIAYPSFQDADGRVRVFLNEIGQFIPQRWSAGTATLQSSAGTFRQFFVFLLAAYHGQTQGRGSCGSAARCKGRGARRGAHRYVADNRSQQHQTEEREAAEAERRPVLCKPRER